MSVAKNILGNTELVSRALEMYLNDPSKPTVEQIASVLEETYHNVSHIIKVSVPIERQRIEKSLRYSRSKRGANSPMFGRTGEKHPNWKGIVSDKKGHYTTVVDGVRYFVHRIVMAQALGLHPSQLPPELQIHHIDENPANNSLDNLVLCTNAGHRKLHRKWKSLRHSPTMEDWQRTISQLKKTTRS